MGLPSTSTDTTSHTSLTEQPKLNEVTFSLMHQRNMRDIRNMALRNVDTRKRRPYRPCVQISRGLAFIFHLALSGQNGEGKTPCRLRLQGLNLLTLYQCCTFLLRIQSQNSHIPTVVSCRYIDHRWHISLCGMRRNMSLLHLRVSSFVLLSPDDRLEIGLT